jgi:Rrf2 family transcriptional regulator, iron-sulfur cluster assembly transcription factor
LQMFSKSLEAALGAMACLAESYDGGITTLTAGQIATDRELLRPFLAKLLTSLSQAGLVTSKPGRNGGFTLACPPAEISLERIAEAIGYRTRIKCCPFGPEYDGENGKPCAMHDEVCKIRDQVNTFLASSTLEGFTQK